MKIEIGQRIKSLRTEKGITQEELASHLGLSYQAISKWENNISSPDIQLLPLISVYFGVTIDELFEISNETHMDRIDHMLENERTLSTANFTYAHDFLKGILDQNPKCAKAYYLLAQLYNHRAASDKQLASICAKQALEYEPYVKDHHDSLIHTENGHLGDAYYNDHGSLISYYEAFISKHPKFWNGHLYLLDQLIADRHFDRAKAIIAKMKSIKPSCLDTIYEGDIAFAQGNQDKALALWNQSITDFPNTWAAYISRGDRLIKLGLYDEAVSDYETCFSLMEKPRYIDPLTFMAKAYELAGNYQESITSHQRVITLLEEDHGIVSGELVDAPKREIERLRKQQSCFSLGIL